MSKLISPKMAVKYLKTAEIIAYPTEAVYGLGCDPDNVFALEKLVSLKKRSSSKGLILIASNMNQLDFYVDFNIIPEHVKSKITASWPGFVTWVLPINKKNKAKISPILYGNFNSLAVRVSSHPVVIELCDLFDKPLVSTSANISGVEPIRNRGDLNKLFSNKIAGIVNGELGGSDRPSTIIDALTEEVVR